MRYKLETEMVDNEGKTLYVEFTVNHYKGNEPGMGWYYSIEDIHVLEANSTKDISNRLTRENSLRVEAAIDDYLSRIDLHEMVLDHN